MKKVKLDSKKKVILLEAFKKDKIGDLDLLKSITGGAGPACKGQGVQYADSVYVQSVI